MGENNSHGSDGSYENVPLHDEKSVQVGELAHEPSLRKNISKRMIEGIAVEKYKSCGDGITFIDLEIFYAKIKSWDSPVTTEVYRNKIP